jgi:uncharacterized damage-inducible protein DinB
VLDELLEAWRTNHRITLYLIDHISDDGMTCTLSKHGGRNVAGQLAHMHNVRVWSLQKRAKDLANGLTTFESKTSPGKSELREALATSSGALESFLTGVLSGQPGRAGFKKGIFTTLAYFISHESHHRGSILLTLKTSGHPLDKKAAYAIWGWDRM